MAVAFRVEELDTFGSGFERNREWVGQRKKREHYRRRWRWRQSSKLSAMEFWKREREREREKEECLRMFKKGWGTGLSLV